MSAGPIIAFFPEASFGAALNCVGIAQELRRLGAVPVFICHPGFTGIFAEYGFREYHLPASAGAPVSNDDYWQSFIRTHLPHFKQSPLEQLTTYVAPTWEAIVETVESVEESLAAALRRIAPDLVVLDNVIMFPAIANAGCPWVRVVSCAETELPDPLVPPYLSGLSPQETGARTRFDAAYARATRKVHKRYNRFRRAQGLAPLEGGAFLETSPHLNLLLAPEIVRYPRAVPLEAPRFAWLNGCVRQETRFDPPPLALQDSPLVYLSFGSLGAIDTDLIARMIAVFADFPARFLVNVGGFGDAYDQVPDNVYLGEWFPQPSVVAQCDLFIHHGGNNSFCEALFYGVPSLVMPYCWDGFDNANRAGTAGVGRWLDRQNWTPEQLRAAIAGLLCDGAMTARLQGAAKAMQAAPGTTRAAEAILEVIGMPAARAAV
jgi:MGT family glycosyltransferase